MAAGVVEGLAPSLAVVKVPPGQTLVAHAGDPVQVADALGARDDGAVAARVLALVRGRESVRVASAPAVHELLAHSLGAVIVVALQKKIIIVNLLTI